MLIHEVCLMADYNQWMNTKIYQACGQLSPTELALDRGAFFRSILGTLNHLVVADIIWLKRFATHPHQPQALNPIHDVQPPQSLDQILFANFVDLESERIKLDQIIQAWAQELTAADLEHILDYHTTKGIPHHKRMGDLILHFFNHQTHHRGQLSTLLSQAEQTLDVTDLLVLIPNA